LAVVKVRLPPADTVRLASPVPAVVVTVTLALGWDWSRTVKVLVPPSGTLTAVDETTSAWALSLSASVAVTVTLVKPDAATVNGRVPLVVSVSSAAQIVTVWGTFQLADV